MVQRGGAEYSVALGSGFAGPEMPATDMDNAAALQPLNANAVAAAGSQPNAFLARLSALPLGRKLLLGGGLLLLLGALVASLMWGRADSYKVLYANLSDKDGGAIIAQLSQMNVP
ncbi:MAG: hypothetical protein RIQ60_4504, partial [Pseudomonadota bacterium]